MSYRLLLVPLVLALVALGGCKTRDSRGVVADEGQAESARLYAEVRRLSDQNAELQARLDTALAEKGGSTIGDDVAKIAGGPIEGFETTASGGVALPDDFAFAKGSAELTAEGAAAIDRLAKRLSEGENAGKAVIVEGHTDDTPVARSSTKEKFGDNWGLSAMRSATVIRALEKAGVSANRLKGAFRGQHQPRDQGADKDAKAKNRRVEIYLGR